MSKHLLPLIPAGLLVQQILPAPDRLTIVVTPLQTQAACPTCGTPSRHIHSRYERVLHDLPWQGRPVRLLVRARRFRCLDPACSRVTFAERIADTAPPAARRTGRLDDLQRHLGLAAGGEAGARLAARLAMPISADTLLRMVRRAGTVPQQRPPVRVLAVDDWAWRRGHRYTPGAPAPLRARSPSSRRSSAPCMAALAFTPSDSVSSRAAQPEISHTLCRRARNQVPTCS